MKSLYPIKFKPIIKEKIWGGTRLKNLLNKNVGNMLKAGESWELSAYGEDLSVVENGFLKDNNIEELIEIYMGDLVGDKVYDKFGLEFPLLIKFIDANDYLSIQVHPDDEFAFKHHNACGKTEMWYIIDAEKDAELIVGFNKEINKQKYLQHYGSGTLREVLNFEKVNSDDVFFMPAGRVHATGPGILFAEIQQTSDLTYRIYDWERLGDDGKPRELHTELAVNVMDFSFYKKYKTDYEITKNRSSKIVSCEYFTTNILDINQEIEKDYNQLDSFVIYMAFKGDTLIQYSESEEPILLKKGETVLLPAVLKQIFLKPINGESKLMEVYID